MKKIFLILIFTAGIVAEGFSQRKDSFASLEDSIIQLHRSVISENNTILRYQQNEQLLFLLEETLSMKNSMTHPFNRLRTISVLTSKDKKVRIFTWYLINEQGSHEYYGYIQAYSDEKKDYRLFPLIDKWSKINNPEAQMLMPNNWYGALYTEIIEIESASKKYYTLLGWNGGDIFSQCKLIEVLSISNKGVVSFGANIFKGYSKARTLRVVFQYAKNSPFTLHYDKQAYTKRSDKRDAKTKKYMTDTIAGDMIIFNQLIPMDESLQTISQFMVGEASLHDAFVEKEGKWVFYSNVVARNPAPVTKGKQVKQPPKEKNKPRKLYTPVE